MVPNCESNLNCRKATTGTLRRPFEAKLRLCKVFSRPRKALSDTAITLQLVICKLMILRFLNRKSVRLPMVVLEMYKFSKIVSEVYDLSRVIYYRVLTTKPLEDRDLEGCILCLRMFSS